MSARDNTINELPTKNIEGPISARELNETNIENKPELVQQDNQPETVQKENIAQPESQENNINKEDSNKEQIAEPNPGV